MNSVPADIQQILDQMDDAERTADAIAAGVSAGQFTWQPDGGGSWSIAQCLEHLATINVLYSAAIRPAVNAARERGWTRQGPLAPGPFGRWFIRHQEPPVKHRVKAPGSVRPGSGLSREEILRRYRESHVLVKQLARDAATIDANRATYPNPFLKVLRFKVATGLCVLPAHERRHLWQAERVRQRPDFPPS
jgi:hypothetical protein